VRIVAAIYLTIVLVDFGLWFARGSGGDPFPTPYSYVMWGLYGLSILALLAYVLRVSILPRRVWQAVLILFLACRLGELAITGLPLNGGDVVADLNTITSYLWLVMPPALAIWYLGFMHAPSREGRVAGMRLTTMGR